MTCETNALVSLITGHYITDHYIKSSRFSQSI